jgi:hypothetical protein
MVEIVNDGAVIASIIVEFVAPFTVAELPGSPIAVAGTVPSQLG